MGAKKVISVRQLKSGLNSNRTSFSSSDFFRLHRYLEAYIKRVLLIGLRLNKVKYKESVTIVENTHLNTASLIEKALFLLDSSNKKQLVVLNELKSTYGDFFVLNELLLKFSSRYRNRLAHGVIDELKDDELINLLCYINQSFVKEFENILNLEHGHSAYDQPKKWGAERGIDEDISVSAKKLKLGKILEQPLLCSTVKKKLAITNYPLKEKESQACK